MMIFEVPPLLIAALIPACIILWRALRRKTNGAVNPKGKAILITGCDSGIGYETALLFDGMGFTVFAGCLFPEGNGAKELKENASNSLMVIELDVTSDNKVLEAANIVNKQLKEEKVKLWAVINNAGVCILGFFEWYPWSQIQKMVDINLMGQIRVLKAFLPFLKKSKGRIVTISSVVRQMAFPGSSVYAATKYGVEGLSDTLRTELQPSGIRVIIIQPGDHSKQTNITKLQRVYADEQWEHLSSEQKNESKDLFDAFHESTVSKNRSKIPSRELAFQSILGHLEEAVCSTQPSHCYVSGPSRDTVFVRLIGMLPTSWKDRLIMRFVRKSWKLDLGNE